MNWDYPSYATQLEIDHEKNKHQRSKTNDLLHEFADLENSTLIQSEQPRCIY